MTRVGWCRCLMMALMVQAWAPAAERFLMLEFAPGAAEERSGRFEIILDDHERVLQGVLMIPSLGNLPLQVDIHRLLLNDHAIDGEVFVRRPEGRVAYRFSGQRDGDTITGEHLLEVPEDRGSRVYAGQFRGRLSERSEFEQSTDPLPERARWTAWGGIDQTNSVPETGVSLVPTLDRARYVWSSRARLPGGRGQDMRRAGVPGGPLSGGMASTLVADGLVVQYHWRPSGDAVWQQRFDEHRRKRGGENYDKYRLLGDDVYQAFNATNGHLVWERVFPAVAPNIAAMNKGGPQLTPVIAEGRVFAIGLGGDVYALDLATGDPLWISDIGPRAVDQKLAMATVLEQGAPASYRSDFCANPRLAGDVLVVPDFEHYRITLPGQDTAYHYDHKPGLIGIDVATGGRLWHRRAVIGKSTTPLAFESDGRWFTIGVLEGMTTCLEARTGEVAWRIPGTQLTHHPLLAGDVLVANGSGTAGLSAWRVSASGAEYRWSLPDFRITGNVSMAVAGGVVYATVTPDGSQPDAAGGLPATDTLVAVDLATGRILGSRPDTNLGGGEHGGFLIHADGKLFSYASYRGYGFQTIDADPDSLRVLGSWHAPMAEIYINAIAPAIADGRLYYRSPTGLVCMDLRQR